MMNFIHKRKQRGIGLLELMLALAIIVILLVMATRYFLVASLNEKVNTMISTVGGFQASLNCYQGSKVGVTLYEMSKVGCLASQLWDNASETSIVINGPWGAGTWKAPTTDVPYGIVTYPKLPEKACNALKNKYLNDDNAKLPGTCATGNTNIFSYEIH